MADKVKKYDRQSYEAELLELTRRALEAGLSFDDLWQAWAATESKIEGMDGDEMLANPFPDVSRPSS